MDGEELGLLDGTGTGDEGGGGDGGEETFISDAPMEDAGGTDTGGTGGDQGADAAGGDPDAQSRAIVKSEPTAIRKAIREITASNPEFAKRFPNLERSVTTALYKAGQLTQYGGLQRVAQVFEAIEVHGGVEQVAAMAEDIAGYKELERGFERGDPKVVEGWAKDFPLGFKKIMVPALEHLETIDAGRFDEVGSMVTTKIFNRYGVFGAVAALGSALAAKNADEATKSFNDLAKFLGEMKSLAEKARSGVRTDRDAELDERENRLTENSKKEFYGTVRQDVNTQVMSEINRLIRMGLPKGKKINVTQANRLRKEINAELARVVNSAAGYADKYKSVMNAGDRERSVRFIVSSAKTKLPNVVTQLLKEFNLMTPV